MCILYMRFAFTFNLHFKWSDDFTRVCSNWFSNSIIILTWNNIILLILLPSVWINFCQTKSSRIQAISYLANSYLASYCGLAKWDRFPISRDVAFVAGSRECDSLRFEENIRKSKPTNCLPTFQQKNTLTIWTCVTIKAN